MTMAVGVTARACDPLGSRITKTVEWDKGRRGWRVRIAMGHVTSEFGVYTTPEEASYVGDAVIGYKLACWDYRLACWRRDGKEWA